MSEVQKLVLMLDYEADPVWEDCSGGMVGLNGLPLTDVTRKALREWAARWQEEAYKLMLVDEDDDSAAPAWVDDEGRELWRRAREELAPQGLLLGYAVSGTDTVLVEWAPGATPERPGWSATPLPPARTADGRRLSDVECDILETCSMSGETTTTLHEEMLEFSPGRPALLRLLKQLTEEGLLSTSRGVYAGERIYEDDWWETTSAGRAAVGLPPRGHRTQR